MSLHKEISFEVEVCDWLSAHNWLYESDDAERYDRARALHPPDLVAWVGATQPKAWETLASNHGASATNVLLDRVRKQLDDRGTLDLLRHGVEMIGLRQQLMLAQFRPALAMNADIVARYEARRRLNVSNAPILFSNASRARLFFAVDALGGLRSLRARSALDGVSWAQGGLVEIAVSRWLAACNRIGAVVCSLPGASLLLIADDKRLLATKLLGLLAIYESPLVRCRAGGPIGGQQEEGPREVGKADAASIAMGEPVLA